MLFRLVRPVAMTMTPKELRALMAEPDDTSATAGTAAAFIETPEERGARIIHDMMMDAAFERWERDQGLNVLPFLSRASGGDRAAQARERQRDGGGETGFVPAPVDCGW